MRIVVCIKQVPDTDARLAVSESGAALDLSGANWVISSSDLCALEEALLLAEAVEAEGGVRPELLAVSLGPGRVEEALRKALALGVDRALHLCDDCFAGGDAIADGRVLAAALEREDCDLVLCGAQSDDAGQGATAGVVAQILGWPYVWLAVGVELDPAAVSVRVARELEGGMTELLRLKLPAVLAIQSGTNKPRFASLRGTLQARRKPLEVRSAADLGVDPALVGEAGARTRVTRLRAPATGSAHLIEESSPEAAALELIAHLEREGLL